MGGPTAGTVDCSVGVIVPESPNPELDELRELRSSKLEKKDLPQEFCLWKRTARSSETLGCIIVDTCAVIHEPDIIEISIKNKILVVVPFPVLCELDKLHKSGKYSSHKKAQQAMHCLKKSSMSQHLIFEDSSESLNEVNGFKVAKNNNDDLILRCAFKIQVNLPADCVDSRIFFITDDCNLSLKAHAHHVKYLTAKQYLAELQKSGLSISLEPEEEPMEIDPPQDPVIPPQDM
ncbi:unnamed protein product [Cylicostephanus goldi]|uniref:PIN domain-containing protein n=1 Tax=Cylicostephanus goldi TaxID=71465 RepID=A0A3P7MEQ4_CYLGO|nr:unnamed protein product [Cylicostephanus goldi]